MISILFIKLYVQKSMKTEMSEYRNAAKKVSPASLVLPLVRHIIPASAFRHRRQSGTAVHGLFRQCPAMVVPTFQLIKPVLGTTLAD
jgi:hypothetical protein